MSRPPFTETHVHFHDLRPQQLHYSWLLPGAPEDEDLGDYGAIRSERYWADDFLGRGSLPERRAGGARAERDRDRGPGRGDALAPGLRGPARPPHGVVAYADLAAPDAREELERHLEFPVLRGIRDLRYDDYATKPDWERGYALLASSTSSAATTRCSSTCRRSPRSPSAIPR